MALMAPEELVGSKAFLDAITARTPQATFSVEVLTPDRSAVLARLGSPIRDGEHAATGGGFESVKVWHNGDSGKPTWVHEMTTRDPMLLPGGINPDATLIDPFQRNWARLWWWLRVEGEWQRLSCGTGRFNAIAANDGNGFVATLYVRDLLADVARAKWNEIVPMGGLPVSDAARALIASRAAWAPVQIAPTIERLPEDWAHGEPDADPTEDLARMAEAVGATCRTTPMGDLVFDPILDVQAAPVRARFIEGHRQHGDGITAFEAISTSYIDLDDVENDVTIASASPSVDPPVSGRYRITDPTHDLFVGNGLHSRSLSNAIVTLAEQAETMSRNRVQQQAVAQTVVIRHPPRPDLRAGDVVELARARMAVSGRWRVLDWRLDSALGPQETTLATDRRWAV